jgi:nucleoside-diphosphate-sugar epimerase
LPDGFCPDLSSRSDYTNSKAIGEMYTRRYGATLNTLIFRIFHPYGKYGDYFLVNKLVKLIRNEKLITIHGKCGPLLNPVSVKDVCKAFQHSIIQGKTGVINVGGPSYLTLYELVKKIAKSLDIKLEVEHLKERTDNNHACSITYLAKYLNWSPQITIDQGLADIYKYN